MQIEEEWIIHNTDELQRRYGAGTFVAIFDWAVIDWGPDAEIVRQRAEVLIGESVYVGVVPTEPELDLTKVPQEESIAIFDRYRSFRKRAKALGDKRRVRIDFDGFTSVEELDIAGQRTEMIDGIIIIDGVEKRYADHDYRLLVEHGIIPKETELIAGIIFHKRLET